MTLSVGIFATATFDLMYLAFYLLADSAVDWSMLGRIIGYLLFKGQFVVLNWTLVPALPYENFIGWCAHYFVGVAYAFFYIYVILNKLTRVNQVWKSIVFLWCMTIFPFLFLDPISGSGIFDLATRHPVYNILMTFCAHTYYGFCLWAWTNLLKIVTLNNTPLSTWNTIRFMWLVNLCWLIGTLSSRQLSRSADFFLLRHIFLKLFCVFSFDCSLWSNGWLVKTPLILSANDLF